MKSNKATLLWKLYNELGKYKKSKQILKQDFIYNNLINNIQQLQKNKIEITDDCINSFINTENDNFPERYSQFRVFYEQLKIFDIKILKKKEDSNIIQAFAQQFSFYYCCKYKTPFFLKPQFYFPNLVDLQLNEIIFWILNVELQEKQIKKNSNYFLVYVKEIKNKKDNEDIKEILINLIKKIIKHVKYGKTN